MSKNPLKIIILILVIPLVLVIAWLVFFSLNDNSPEFFPLNNTKANYEIVRCGIGDQGDGLQVSGKELFCMEYTGKGTINEGNFMRVSIGISDVNLEQFIGRKITYINGSWGSSDKQCVVSKPCVEFGKRVVLNVNSLVASK